MFTDRTSEQNLLTWNWILHYQEGKLASLGSLPKQFSYNGAIDTSTKIQENGKSGIPLYVPIV